MRRNVRKNHWKVFVTIGIIVLVLGIVFWLTGAMSVWMRIGYYKLFTSLPTNLTFTFTDCSESDRHYELLEEKIWKSDDILYLKVKKSFDCNDVYFIGDYEITDKTIHLKALPIGYRQKEVCLCPVSFEYTLRGLSKKHYDISF